MVDLTIHSADVRRIDVTMIRGMGANTATLTALRLLKCNIEQIDTDALRLLVSLKELELPENKLKTIAPGLFSGNKFLTRIVLRANRIESLAAATFSQLESLDSLDLSQNQLRAIPADLPRGLKHLYLGENQIQRVDSIPFPNLQRLNLCNNQIFYFNESAVMCPKLEYLCLGDIGLHPTSTGIH